MRTPDFDQLLAVLKREVPDRVTLFELFLNEDLYELLGGPMKPRNGSEAKRQVLRAFCGAGYDYATVHGSSLRFRQQPVESKQTRSLNQGAAIVDDASFEAYQWPDMDQEDYHILDVLGADLPPDMKLVVMGPGGVLENVIDLMGYDNLCYALVDNPELVEKVAAGVGHCLASYYRHCAAHPAVGALISNDDWGFKTQTMLAPTDMRRYIFPHHEEIVQTAHARKKPIILHSCGNLEMVMEDIIAMGYDARHSYEDAITPVEEVYERYGSRIAVLGGIDVDFLCRASSQEVEARSRWLWKNLGRRGGYALGSGNSIPSYVPPESFFAMISLANPQLRPQPH